MPGSVNIAAPALPFDTRTSQLNRRFVRMRILSDTVERSSLSVSRLRAYKANRGTLLQDRTRVMHLSTAIT